MAPASFNRRSGSRNLVPIQTLAADHVFETGIVAGLDKTELAFLVRSGLGPLPAAEMALKTGIGGNMGYQDPGTSAGWRLFSLDRPLE